jgi:hypothetical protein
MTFSEQVQHYFQSNYVIPARERGQATVQVKAGEIHSKLGWTRRVPLVCAALSSQKLQRKTGVRLKTKEGPPSGQSPTVVFHYEILGTTTAQPPDRSKLANGIGLMDLYGIGAEAFKQLGGGEEYLRREREGLRFPAEEYFQSGTQDES